MLVKHRTMNFSYIDDGQFRVVTARVMVAGPSTSKTVRTLDRILSNVALSTTHLFAIEDEDVEYESGCVITNSTTWRLGVKRLTKIKRSENKVFSDRGCICCALADYFKDLVPHWVRDAQDIIIDVVAGTHEDETYIECEPDISNLMKVQVEASVFYVKFGGISWPEYGVLFTDNLKYDGATIILHEDDEPPVSSTDPDTYIVKVSSDTESIVLGPLDQFVHKVGVYGGTLFLRDDQMPENNMHGDGEE